MELLKYIDIDVFEYRLIRLEYSYNSFYSQYFLNIDDELFNLILN